MKPAFSWSPSLIFRFFNPAYLICRMPADEKAVYLTFDDGPNPEVTPGILSILAEKKASATFFCTGRNVKKHPDIFRMITDAGHSVGNHTFHHLDGWKTPPGEYAENVTRCEDLIATDLFRPPYGRFTPSQYFLLRKKYRFVIWSLMSYDYHRKMTPENCLATLIRSTTPGSIIVFHDTPAARTNVLYVLPRFIDHFTASGFEFRRISSPANTRNQSVPSSAKL